jgi:hypothetical protein
VLCTHGLLQLAAAPPVSSALQASAQRLEPKPYSKWLLDLASDVLPAATETLLALTDPSHRATLRRSPRALAVERRARSERAMSKVHSGSGGMPSTFGQRPVGRSAHCCLGGRGST